MKLNQWQREILKLEQQTDKDMNRKLYNAYNDSLKDVRKRLKTYMDEHEDLPYYKQQQAGKLSALEKEIVEMLNGAYPKAKHEVTDFKRNEMMDGYYSSMYQIEAETGARLDFLGLDTEFVRQTVANPIAGKTLSKRLYTSRTKLANRATSELRIGMMQGKTYAEISGTISRHTEANYKQAVRIARTEGGRLRSLSKQVAYDEAKEMGIDLQKRWYSSLDNRTRSSHRELDGQTVEIDEKFKYGGHEADGPRLFGKANLDINCRCTTITVVDGIEPGTRLAKNETLVNGKIVHEYESIPYKNYSEWKDKRIIANDAIIKAEEASNKFKDVLKDVDFSKSRKTISKKVLQNLGIGDIPVSVKKIKANGHCLFGTADDGIVTITEFALNSKVDTSSDYQMKTIFHEAYHATNHGRKSDWRTGTFGAVDWLDIEEAFAETSAHFAVKQAGINTQLSPAYPEKLVNVLPRLKKLDKFKNASQLSDFGEIAWSDRLAGQASTWEKLAKEASDIDHDWVSYGNQYGKYIRENENKLHDMMLQAMPQYDNEYVRKMMVGDLHNALDKAEGGGELTSNEKMVYSNILIIAMDSIGVK
ncbi:phage minor head protein [Jeotgalibaca porci]|uniref:phage minor head protein n=1 Tax=Jeotgalibaca porci TaxID=1868793 RepID=UPI0035A137AA